MKRTFASNSCMRVKSSHHEYLSLFICIVFHMMIFINSINASSPDTLTATYKLETIAGGNLGDGFSGQVTPIGHPQAIAFYPRTIPTPIINLVEDERPQDLIIIDGSNNLIRKLTYNWTGVVVDPEQEIFDNIPTIVSTIAGVASSGSSSNDNTDGLPANTVKLTNPNTVTVSLLTGDIYFVENNPTWSIKKIDINGTLSTFASNNLESLCSDAPSTLNDAQLSDPSQIVYSLEGVEEFIYIADTKNFRIRKLSITNKNITTIAGKCGQEGYYGNGISANEALLSEPTGIALFRIEDAPINTIPEIYIADRFYIRKIVNGNITTIAGSGSGPVPGVLIQPNVAALNASIAPTSIAVGEEGEVYFLEQSQHTVKLFNPTTNFISVFAGTGSNVGPIGDGGMATAATLNSPSFIAISAEEIIIADCMNNRIRKVGEDGIISTIFGNGQETYLGDNGPATHSAISPNHIHVAQKDGADVITIADGKNNRIRRINQQGIISTVIGSSAPINGYTDLDGKLANSTLISNPSASFYVSSTGETYFNVDNVIYKILPNGVIKRVAGGVLNTFAGDGQVATSSILFYPTGVFASKTSVKLYIADSGNNRIRIINESGVISTIDTFIEFPTSVYEFENNIYFTDLTRIGMISADGVVTVIAGKNVSGYNGNNITATDALLNNPNGLHITVNGDIYFADTGNNRVRKISNGIITSVSGNGQPTYAGDGSKACCASLNGPTSLSISSTGEIYIVDNKNDRIRKIGLDGNITTLVEVLSPVSIVISNADEIYIAHSNMISKFDNGNLQLIAGSDSNYQFNGDGLANVTSLNFPSSLSLNSAGDIFIADSGNNRIRKLSNNIIETVAGGIGDGLLATQAVLSSVSSFVVSSSNEIFIADNVANRIRKVSSEGIIETIAGTYNYGFNGDNIKATLASLANPTSVSLSSEGEVFISDYANHRIRKISNNGIITTILENSETHHSVYYPRSVTVSPKGDYLIICNGDSTIVRFNLKEENATCFVIAGKTGINGFNGEVVLDSNMALLNRPSFTDISQDGSTIYIADSGNNRLRKLTALCPKGYRLNNAAVCEKLPRVCFGLLPSNETVCSGNGICESYNNCSCNSGYYGEQCEFFGCNGIPNDDPTVCSSRGACVSANNCTCNSGYYGAVCEHFDCFGVEHSNPSVCSSAGICTEPSKCECKMGHHGEFCQYFTCFEKESNDTTVCSGHGVCSSGNNCTCEPGYYGEQCENYGCFGLAHNDEKVCSAHGTCQAIDKCVCKQNYNGSNCELFYCNGLEHADPNVCSSNGLCSAPGICECKEAYYGQNCESFSCYDISSSNSTVCSGHGVCSSGNNCTCDNGYSGKECQIYQCFGNINTDKQVCSGNGICKSIDNCECQPGYYGKQCQHYDCHGLVHNDTNVCSSKGTCVGPNNCLCNEGYHGTTCELYTCDSIPSNDTGVCSGHGVCVSANNCSCAYGYEGANCETFSCSGVNKNDPQVCSGNGVCSSFNNCTCNTGFSGINCENYFCYGIHHSDPNVCSGNGVCSAPNQCECTYGYSGVQCTTNIICQPGDTSLFCTIANNTALKNLTETNILAIEDMEDMESFNITFTKFKDIFIVLPASISDYLENILRDEEIPLNMASSVSDIRSINSKVLSPAVTFIITQENGQRVPLSNLPQPILLNMHNIIIPKSSLARHESALSSVSCAYYEKSTDSWKTDRVTTTILSAQQGATSVTYSVVCSTTHWPSSFALIAQPITPTASSGKTPQPTQSPTQPQSSKKPTNSGTVITEKGDKSYIVVLVGFILMIIIAIVIGVGYYIYKKKQGQTTQPNQTDGNGNYATLTEEP